MNTSVYVKRNFFGEHHPKTPFETVTLSMKTKDFINKIRNTNKKPVQDDLITYRMIAKKNNYRTKRSDAVINPIKQQIMKLYDKLEIVNNHLTGKSDCSSVVSEKAESTNKQKKILPNPKKIAKKQKQRIKKVKPLKSIKKIAGNHIKKVSK